MKSRELIKEIQADGWYLARVTGSHHHFKHDNKHTASKKGSSQRTIKSILKQAGLV
ncbi:type II toxin-antitoxin system HicA family toxin [Psychrobacter glacincola]|uniref:type II toxin-antitoxin system HicA family toxin n=1 Tax=Psychrobacter glacincola TaxID=56810 RepID=UPI00191B3391|nr:type II toxin-antitoxin system HicA family toxin [Psychrobacter glacincola]